MKNHKLRFRIEVSWFGSQKMILQVQDFKKLFGERPEDYQSRVPYWRDAQLEDVSGEFLMKPVAQEAADE